MRKKPILWSLLLTLAAAPALAASVSPIPPPPDVSTSNFLVVDFQSGATLAEKDALQPVEPASITKVMTAYVVFRELEAGNIRLDDTVTISEHAWRKSKGTSRMFLEPRTQVKVEELLQGMIIQSGNDASIALAEHIAGTEETFASLMNAYAAELGLSGSSWRNSTGLPDDEHYTTARDLVRLASAVISQFPDFYRWYSQPSYTYNGISQPNRNRLLGNGGVDGMKTGWTESAGYCLLTSAVRDGRRIVSVVLNSSTENKRVVATQALLNYGFRFFETHRLYAAGDEITRVRVWRGSSEYIGLGVTEDLFVTVPRGRYQELSAMMDLTDRLLAPVTADEEVGQVSVSLDDNALVEKPLYPLTAVAEGSLWQRISDSVLLWLE